jgi:hypothetical protein
MVDLPIYAYPGVDILVSPLTGNPSSQLRQEFEGQKTLFQSQTPLVQQFLENQAHSVSDALVNHLPRVQFYLPDKITSMESYDDPVTLPVPNDRRQQRVNGRSNPLVHINLEISLCKRLSELDQFSNRAVSLASRMVRHAIAVYMVHTMLPSGHTVNYIPAEGEDIPTIPLTDGSQALSNLTDVPHAGRLPGDFVQDGPKALIVPYAQAALCFYMPQWVAFNQQGSLLLNTITEAEAHIASMQRFLEILRMAFDLAPYIVADETFQQKRFGMLGQLVNQGRALAYYKTNEIIRSIQRRTAARQLNRGLSLSLPYFDDQDLSIKMLEIKIIPFGRIMFVPAFMVLAIREHQTKVSQDMRLSSSTRKHLLNELNILEHAFITSTDE